MANNNATLATINNVNLKRINKRSFNDFVTEIYSSVMRFSIAAYNHVVDVAVVVARVITVLLDYALNLAKVGAKIIAIGFFIGVFAPREVFEQCPVLEQFSSGCMELLGFLFSHAITGVKALVDGNLMEVHENFKAWTSGLGDMFHTFITWISHLG